VRNGWLDLTEVARVPVAVHERMARSHVHPSDVLLNITGASIGRSCVVPSELATANVNQHVCIVRPTAELLPGYLQAILESPRLQHRIRTIAAGGSREGLNHRQVASLMIPYVGEDTQVALTWVRALCDRLSQQLRRVIQLRRAYKRGLMQELLTGRRRFPEFACENSWKTVPLGEVAKNVTRRNTGDEVALVLTCSGTRGLIDQRDYFSKTVAGDVREEYFLMRRGEFAYNRSTMAGYPYGAIKRLDRYEAGVLSTLNICFALTGDRWMPDFAVHFFESGLLNRQLGRITRVGSRAHGLLNVTKSDFFALQVPLPSVAEQLRIVGVLNALDREIETLERVGKNRETLKSGLMQKLLSGGTDVPQRLGTNGRGPDHDDRNDDS
jgi:type I restriction enzyme, S subunit